MTRRQQFLTRRQRYINRRKKEKNRGYTWVLVTTTGHTWTRTSRANKRPHGPKQLSSRTSGRTWSWFYPMTTPPPFAFFELDGGDGKSPPHVRFIGPLRLVIDAEVHHRDDALIGYHKRRVFAWRRKANRRDGWGRKVLAASVEAHREGYFPMWDPLARRPNFEDGENDLPPYEGPFPYSPRRRPPVPTP